jgi:hypothetical protein
LRRWFTFDVVRNKRSQVAKIIRDLSLKQFPAKKFEFPPIIFTPESGSGYSDEDDNSDEEGFLASIKRNATTIIKVGSKNSTPTKLPPGKHS